MDCTNTELSTDNNTQGLTEEELVKLFGSKANITTAWETLVKDNHVDYAKPLQSLIDALRYLDSNNWQQTANFYNKSCNLQKGLVELKGKDIYKPALRDMITKAANDLKLDFQSDGKDLYTFTGKYWEKINIEHLSLFIQECALKIGIIKAVAEESKFRESVIAEISSQLPALPSDKKYSVLLNMSNCTLELEKAGTLKQLPFDKNYNLRYILDYDYDPNAKNVLWLKFLDEVLPEKDVQKTLQQALGLLFAPYLKIEKVTFLFGRGSNGKSVVFEVLKGLLDESLISFADLTAIASKTARATAGYHQSELMGKLVNYGSDASLNNVDPDTFKKLASREEMSTRKIGGQPFKMANYARLIFNINTISMEDMEMTEGHKRRLLFIPFEQQITKPDIHLHKKILKNKAGVFNWIMEGLEEVVKNGSLYLAPKCANFLDDWMQKYNPMNQFLKEADILDKQGTEDDYDYAMGITELYDRYKQISKEHGEKPKTRAQLGNILENQLGYKRSYPTGGTAVWYLKK